MQSIHTRAKYYFPISIIRHPKKSRGLDSPTEARGLAFRLHHPAGHILPLRLRTVKGRKLFPLTVLVSAAHATQRDGSNGSRSVRRISNQDAPRSVSIDVSKNRFPVNHKLHFLHKQSLEEADEAYDEFESAS
jgi:hypothetical protein